MNTYISILRGINVSGRKIIKMAELKSLYESLGFEKVVTYIQSGNVIFRAPMGNKASMKAEIEGTIEEKYGFHVPVVIRTPGELKHIIEHCPFGPVDLSRDGAKVLLTFLFAAPGEAEIAGIRPYVVLPEKLMVIGEAVYLYCPDGYGQSKLSNTFIEGRFKVEATTRNWKTVVALYEMSGFE